MTALILMPTQLNLSGNIVLQPLSVANWLNSWKTTLFFQRLYSFRCCLATQEVYCDSVLLITCTSLVKTHTHIRTHTHSHRFKQHFPLYPVRAVKSCSSYGCTSKRSPVNETQPAQSVGPVLFCQHWTNRKIIPLNGCVTHMYIYTFSPVFLQKITKRHFRGRKRKARSRMQQVCKVWLVLFIALSLHLTSLWKKIVVLVFLRLCSSLLITILKLITGWV